MEYDENRRNMLLQDMIDFQFDCYLRGRDVNIIGENIKYFRDIWHFSSNELCKRAEISRSTLYKIESGKVIPKLSTLIKIVDALSLVGDSFLEFVEEIKKHPTEELLGDSDVYNIYKMEEEIMKMFHHHLCYYQNGKRKYFPQQHIEILKNSISSAFSVLDLVNHDKDQGEEFHMINNISDE